ncbi:MAG: response regulator transcription factor [Phycisphaerales bacterium]|nr:response regulator transcription factor [Phycisphaerales bacterium]
MTEPVNRISVLCVDDNQDVARALRRKLSLVGGFDWRGWLPDAESLLGSVRQHCPAVVLLDIDMPGPDPFGVLAEITAQCPDTRVIVFSGHIRRDLIDRALDSGAWAYVSKNDGDVALVDAIRRVTAGEFVVSPEAQAVLDRG